MFQNAGAQGRHSNRCGERHPSRRPQGIRLKPHQTDTKPHHKLHQRINTNRAHKASYEAKYWQCKPLTRDEFGWYWADALDKPRKRKREVGAALRKNLPSLSAHKILRMNFMA